MSAAGGDAQQVGPGRAAAVTETETDLVLAARAGDRQAVAALLGAHLPMLYRIVGRALDGHADVDDVVQETVLRAHRDLPALRTPESFRSWLVAIAMRRISSRLQLWRQERERTAPVDDATRIPDPDAEFADVALLRLGLSAQRRQAGRATGWLDPADRRLAVLWWQEQTGGRTRAEMAAVLGIGAAHTRVRIQRLRRQLELCRLLVAALEADPLCPGLRAAGAGWNGTPSPRWRKRFARHLRGCERCGSADADLIPVERLLLGGAPALATTDPLGAGTDWFAELSGTKMAAALVAGVAATVAVVLALPGLPADISHAAGPLTHPTAGTTESTAVDDRVRFRPTDRPGDVVDLDGDRLVVTTGTLGVALTMTPGLTDPRCFSLRYADGRYVRHASFQLVLDDVEDSLLFREDATFCLQPGPTAGTVRFTSANYPDRFVRVVDRRLRLEPGAAAGATFTLSGA